MRLGNNKLLIYISLPLLAIIAVLGFGLGSFWGLSSLQGSAKWVKHSHEVIIQAHLIEKLIIDLETGQRGYLITGNENFLEPYDKAEARLNDVFVNLSISVADNPPQVERLTLIKQQLMDWYRLAGDPEIGMRNQMHAGQKDSDYLQLLLSKEEGKGIIDNIRIKITTLETLFNLANKHQAHIYTLSIVKGIIDMETGERGFLITGESSFLKPFHEGRKNLEVQMAKLNAILDQDMKSGQKQSYNTHLARRTLNDIQNLHQRWLDNAAGPEISARKEMNTHKISLKDISLQLEKNIGKGIIDKLRGMLDEFIHVEEQLLTLREKFKNIPIDQRIAATGTA